MGFAFVALSLSCLQIVLDRGQEDDWLASGFITAMILISAATFALLIWWELRHPEPMVDLRLMRSADFATTFVLMAMLGFMILGSTYLVPAYAQTLLGYRAVDAGMALTPGGLATIALLPLVGRVINKVDVRLLVAVGIAVCGLSLLWMTHFYLGMTFQQLMLARIVQSASLAFLFVPINAIAFRSIPPSKTNNASALINLARNLGGSIGISFASTLLTRRAQFHQSRLIENLQSMNGSYPDYAHQLGSALGTSADSSTTLSSIYQTAVEQATLLSYLDAFKVVGLIFLSLLPLLLLVKRGKGGAAALAH
jgi:DHA2 family multidrug resistance protein